MSLTNTPRPVPAPSGRRWDPWPASIIAFFALAIGGFVTFIVFCHQHPTDLVAADYYEQEIRYQAELDQLRRTRQLATVDWVRYDPVAKAITIEIPPPEGATRLRGDIHLYRPSSASLDRRFNLELDEQGRQSIDASALPPGLWRVNVRWSAGNQEYRVEQKLVIGATAS
jgi:hypothetical protein